VIEFLFVTMKQAGEVGAGLAAFGQRIGLRRPPDAARPVFEPERARIPARRDRRK